MKAWSRSKRCVVVVLHGAEVVDWEKKKRASLPPNPRAMNPKRRQRHRTQQQQQQHWLPSHKRWSCKVRQDIKMSGPGCGATRIYQRVAHIHKHTHGRHRRAGGITHSAAAPAHDSTHAE